MHIRRVNFYRTSSCSSRHLRLRSKLGTERIFHGKLEQFIRRLRHPRNRSVYIPFDGNMTCWRPETENAYGFSNTFTGFESVFHCKLHRNATRERFGEQSLLVINRNLGKRLTLSISQSDKILWLYRVDKLEKIECLAQQVSGKETFRSPFALLLPLTTTPHLVCN